MKGRWAEVRCGTAGCCTARCIIGFLPNFVESPLLARFILGRFGGVMSLVGLKGTGFRILVGRWVCLGAK